MALQENRDRSVPHGAERQPGAVDAEVIGDHFDTFAEKMIVCDDNPLDLAISIDLPMLLGTTYDAAHYVRTHPGQPYPRFKEASKQGREGSPFVRAAAPETVFGRAYSFTDRRMAFTPEQLASIGEWHNRRMQKWKPVTIAIDDQRVQLTLPGAKPPPPIRMGIVSYERLYGGKMKALIPETMLVGWTPRDLVPARTNQGILPSSNRDELLAYEPVATTSGTGMAAYHVGVEASRNPNAYVPLGDERWDALAYSIHRPHHPGLEPQYPVTGLDKNRDARDIDVARAQILRAGRLYDMRPDKTNRRENPRHKDEFIETSPISLILNTIPRRENNDLINILGQAGQAATDRIGRLQIRGTNITFDDLALHMKSGLEGRDILHWMEKADAFFAEEVVGALVDEKYMVTCTLPMDGRMQLVELPLQDFMTRVRWANAELTRLSDLAMYYMVHLVTDNPSVQRVIRSTKNDAGRIAMPRPAVRVNEQGLHELTEREPAVMVGEVTDNSSLQVQRGEVIQLRDIQDKARDTLLSSGMDEAAVLALPLPTLLQQATLLESMRNAARLFLPSDKAAKVDSLSIAQIEEEMALAKRRGSIEIARPDSPDFAAMFGAIIEAYPQGGHTPESLVAIARRDPEQFAHMIVKAMEHKYTVGFGKGKWDIVGKITIMVETAVKKLAIPEEPSKLQPEAIAKFKTTPEGALGLAVDGLQRVMSVFYNRQSAEAIKAVATKVFTPEELGEGFDALEDRDKVLARYQVLVDVLHQQAVSGDREALDKLREAEAARAQLEASNQQLTVQVQEQQAQLARARQEGLLPEVEGFDTKTLLRDLLIHGGKNKPEAVDALLAKGPSDQLSELTLHAVARMVEYHTLAEPKYIARAVGDLVIEEFDLPHDVVEQIKRADNAKELLILLVNDSVRYGEVKEYERLRVFLGQELGDLVSDGSEAMVLRDAPSIEKQLQTVQTIVEQLYHMAQRQKAMLKQLQNQTGQRGSTAAMPTRPMPAAPQAGPERRAQAQAPQRGREGLARPEKVQSLSYDQFMTMAEQHGADFLHLAMSGWYHINPNTLQSDADGMQLRASLLKRYPEVARSPLFLGMYVGSLEAQTIYLTEQGEEDNRPFVPYFVNRSEFDRNRRDYQADYEAKRVLVLPDKIPAPTPVNQGGQQ